MKMFHHLNRNEMSISSACVSGNDHAFPRQSTRVIIGGNQSSSRHNNHRSATSSSIFINNNHQWRRNNHRHLHQYFGYGIYQWNNGYINNTSASYRPSKIIEAVKYISVEIFVGWNVGGWPSRLSHHRHIGVIGVIFINTSFRNASSSAHMLAAGIGVS